MPAAPPTSRHDHLHRIALLVTGVLAAVIGGLTLTPSDGVPGPSGMDKVYHFVAFAALVWPITATRPRAALWVVPAAIAYGGAIELIQPHVGRHGEWGDVLANSLGALVGAGLGWATHVLARRVLQPLARRG
ncbi:MAG: VanZ family protein [Alkalilacustris sp.]